MRKNSIMNTLRAVCAASKRLAALLVACLVAVFFVRVSAYAQSSASTRIHYPFDNAVVSENYLENIVTLVKVDYIAAVAKDSDNSTITVKSFSSPEGNFAYNKALSERRGAALRDFILVRHPELSGRINIVAGGESWDDVRKAVSTDAGLSASAREAMLRIIDSNLNPDAKEARLRKIDAYKTIIRKYYRRFRYAEVSINELPGKATAAADSVSANLGAESKQTETPDSIATYKSGAREGAHAGADAFVLFPLESTSVEQDYAANKSACEAIAKLLDGRNPEDFESIEVVSGCSIDGSLSTNDRICRQRGQALVNWIENNYPQFKGKVTLDSRGEDWAKLRESVVSDSKLDAEAKSAILAIVDSNDNADSKEAQLRKLDSWQYIQDNLLPKTRYATVVSSSKAEGTESSKVAGQSGAAAAQGSEAAGKDSRTTAFNSSNVFFGLGKTNVEQDYAKNGSACEEIAKLLDGKSPEDFESIVVTSGCSIDGTVEANERVSRQRGQSLVDWIEENYPQFKGKVTLNSRGEDWAKLRESVVSDSNLDKESKFRVLAIIDSDDSAENKEERLRKLECWDYIQEHILPLTRYATVRCSQQPAPEAPELPAEEIADSTESIAVPVDTLAVADTTMRVDTLAYAPEVAPAPAASREPRQLGTIVAAKTNLLYDALTALNFELEFPIGRRFSLDIEDVFPWWETGNKYCFQMWEMGLEARFWFKPWDVRGREKLRGWFVGLYGMSSRFDFQNDKKFNYQGEYWSVGGTLGYSMPLGRNKKANLEFSLSTGYLEAPYRHYYPTDDYVKLIKDPAGNGTFYDIFLYPTKAKISLVVPIPGPKKKEVSHE